ncbi:MAG: DMT family transporter, partial [Asticcacaulis sp.]
TSLVIGFMPVAVTIIGSRDHNAVPLRKLWLSLVFCVAAAVCIGWEGLVKPDAAEAGRKALALCFAVGALASWAGFAVGNSRCLGRLEAISAHQWSLLTGLMTGMQALVLVPVSLVLDNWGLSVGQWGAFVGVSVAVALLASIVGNALWNQMSRHLPLTLVGQMILFETLFALIYGFMWEQRWPSLAEALAFGCVVASVSLCLKAHKAAKD